MICLFSSINCFNSTICFFDVLYVSYATAISSKTDFVTTSSFACASFKNKTSLSDLLEFTKPLKILYFNSTFAVYVFDFISFSAKSLSYKL